MPCTYRPGVHVAVVGRDLVVLDLASDAYFCIVDADTPAPEAGRNANVLSSDVQQSLREAGLLVETVEPACERPALPEKAVSDLRRYRSRPSARAGADAFNAWRGLRRWGPDPTVSDLIRYVGTPTPSTSSPDLRSAAATFADLIPLLPGRHACLQRSALLMKTLHALGLTADWVFVVRTWPFRAHCWVQAGDICLNDRIENLAGYTPILAVQTNYMSDIV